MKKCKSICLSLHVLQLSSQFPTGCGNTNTNKNAEVKIWYGTSPHTRLCHWIPLHLKSPTQKHIMMFFLYATATHRTSRPRSAIFCCKMIQFLSTQGYSYQWVNYGDPGKMDLVIIASTPLLEQDVEITEVNKLPKSGDIYQVAFRFNDRSLWEKITTANIGKRIAICVNGTVLSAPQVNSPITQGACSVTVPQIKCGVAA